MQSLDKLNEKDLEDIDQYISSVKFNLMTLGIDIIYTLFPKEGFTSWIHAYIRSPTLQKSRFMTLFPFCHGICKVYFTRKNNVYLINQEFGLGSLLNNKEILEHVLEIEEGDEWKIQQYREEGKIILIEESLELAKRLIKDLTDEQFKEIDERERLEKKVTYCPSPSLVHRFGVMQFSGIYTGSEINLKTEYIKSLENSRLLENLIKFHNFFYGMIKNDTK